MTSSSTDTSAKNYQDKHFSATFTKSRMELWKENYGSPLFGFALMVFFIGSAILLYRQNRMVPTEILEMGPMAGEGDVEAADALNEKNSVRVVVLGAGSDDGLMRVAVYHSADGFNDPTKAISRGSVNVFMGEAMFRLPLEGLPEKIAISVFHDEDTDGQLNRNRLGVPSERYGFSNDARGLTGPPTYEDAEIEVLEAGETITLSVR